MAKYIIDTEAGTVTPYTETAGSSSKAETMISTLCAHRGDTEYSGLIATIQKWYYGSVVKASWCATTISYLFNKVGIAIKAENVNRLREACKADHYNGTYYEGKDIPATVKRGDILFWLWSGETMSDTSSKHVGIAEYDSNTDKIYCLGGNQKDKICTLEYSRSKLYAIYRLGR